MQPAADAPARPLLRYYGGKWRLAPWVISYLPDDHRHYVEPCGGAASVLLRKPRSYLETYNDLDRNVVNFFRTLRASPQALIDAVRFTPWSREEYELSLQPATEPLEQARRFFVTLMQSIPAAASATPGAWRHRVKVSGAPLKMYTEMLEWAVERLSTVQIENLPYTRILSDYDTPETLFYMDPPYVTTERTNTNIYAYEWDNEEHIAAAELLTNVQGMVVLSGYACDLYTELYESVGWIRIDRETQTNGDARVESLWLSPRTWETLSLPQQAALF